MLADLLKLIHFTLSARYRWVLCDFAEKFRLAGNCYHKVSTHVQTIAHTTSSAEHHQYSAHHINMRYIRARVHKKFAFKFKELYFCISAATLTAYVKNNKYLNSRMENIILKNKTLFPRCCYLYT